MSSHAYDEPYHTYTHIGAMKPRHSRILMLAFFFLFCFPPRYVCLGKQIRSFRLHARTLTAAPNRSSVVERRIGRDEIFLRNDFLLVVDVLPKNTHLRKFFSFLPFVHVTSFRFFPSCAMCPYTNGSCCALHTRMCWFCRMWRISGLARPPSPIRRKVFLTERKLIKNKSSIRSGAFTQQHFI